MGLSFAITCVISRLTNENAAADEFVDWTLLLMQYAMAPFSSPPWIACAFSSSTLRQKGEEINKLKLCFH